MPNRSLPLPMALQRFVDSAGWTSSKSLPEWPHEYLLRRQADDAEFVQLARHIRKHGYVGHYYFMRTTYYEDRGLVYCAMGATPETMGMIFRCRKEDSFEVRLLDGQLPDKRDLVW